MPATQKKAISDHQTFARVILRESSVPIEEQIVFPKNKKDELENILRKSLLEAEGEKRTYRESYDKWHRFQLKYAQNKRDHIYPSNIRRYAGISRLIGTGKHVLEVGYGEGILSIAIAKAGNNVIGTDVSGVILTPARNNRKEGCKHVKFSISY
jgi:2-polyprenyl-3-methyl-5-hydroxy-6-metoxy-1,4-benzoquinol methylase